MGIISVNNEGIKFIEYDPFLIPPDEFFTLASPNATEWQAYAVGEDGFYGINDINGPFPPPIRKVYVSPNGIAWEVTVDNNGVMFLSSFSSSLALSPVGNHQIKLANGTLAVGYKLFVAEYDPTIALSANVQVDSFADTSHLTINPNPLIIGSNGFTSAPIFIEVGKLYYFILSPPSETYFPSIITTQWIGVSVGLATTGSSVTEWVEPAITSTVVSETALTVLGDRRRQFQVGRRVRYDSLGGPPV